jgi:hypothetical protein
VISGFFGECGMSFKPRSGPAAIALSMHLS